MSATYANRGYQQITSTTLASATALTVPSAGAAFALIQCEGVDVRWRDDDTAPTSTVGTILPAGSTLPYFGEMARLQLIRTAAGSILNITYYG